MYGQDLKRLKTQQDAFQPTEIFSLVTRGRDLTLNKSENNFLSIDRVVLFFNRNSAIIISGDVELKNVQNSTFYLINFKLERRLFIILILLAITAEGGGWRWVVWTVTGKPKLGENS